AIEGETMHPAAGEARDAPRIGGAGGNVEPQPPPESWGPSGRREEFAVYPQPPPLDPPPLRQGGPRGTAFCEPPRPWWVAGRAWGDPRTRRLWAPAAGAWCPINRTRPPPPPCPPP